MTPKPPSGTPPTQPQKLVTRPASAPVPVDVPGKPNSYGTTAWKAPELTEVSAKRYRYTGMERDEETGLQCHGVRYYAVWLGRWISADPIGLKGGMNRFVYAATNPISLFDHDGRMPHERMSRFSDDHTPMYGPPKSSQGSVEDPNGSIEMKAPTSESGISYYQNISDPTIFFGLTVVKDGKVNPEANEVTQAEIPPCHTG